MIPLADRFNALVPQEVMEAVCLPGWLPTGRFMVLNSYENRVYQLELVAEDDPDTLRKVVGKFYRPGRWSQAALDDEHDFLFELAQDAVPVTLPLTLNEEGQTIGVLSGAAAGIRYALWPRLAGRSPQELSDGELTDLGAELAALHTVGEAGDAPDRPQLTPETYGLGNLQWLLDNDSLPSPVRASYRATVEALVERITPLFTHLPLHRIHGDCHRGNLIRTADGLVFVDFDDLLIGPAVQDVWMLVPSYDSEGQRQRALLLDAYRTVRDFDPAWLQLIEPLRALRMIHYATWIARRQSDPTFRRMFNHFGTLQYWQGELQDLREQIARIDQQMHSLS